MFISTYPFRAPVFLIFILSAIATALPIDYSGLTATKPDLNVLQPHANAFYLTIKYVGGRYPVAPNPKIEAQVKLLKIASSVETADRPHLRFWSVFIAAPYHVTEEDPTPHATVRLYYGLTPKGGQTVPSVHVYEKGGARAKPPKREDEETGEVQPELEFYADEVPPADEAIERWEAVKAQRRGTEGQEGAAIPRGRGRAGGRGGRRVQGGGGAGGSTGRHAAGNGKNRAGGSGRGQGRGGGTQRASGVGAQRSDRGRPRRGGGKGADGLLPEGRRGRGRWRKS